MMIFMLVSPFLCRWSVIDMQKSTRRTLNIVIPYAADTQYVVYTISLHYIL